MNDLAILLPPEGDRNVEQALKVIKKTKQDGDIKSETHKYQLNKETGRFESLEGTGKSFSFNDESVAVLGIGDKTITEIEKHDYKGFVVATACSHYVDLAHSFTYYINPSCVIKTIYDAVLSNDVFANLKFLCVVQDDNTDDVWVKRCIDQINDFNQMQNVVKCEITTPEGFCNKSDCLIYIPGYSDRDVSDLILSVLDKIGDSGLGPYIVLDPMYCMFEDKTTILNRVGANKLLYVDVPGDVGLPQTDNLDVVLGFVKEALKLADDIVMRGGNPDVIRDIRIRPSRFGNVFFSDSGEVYHETRLVDAQNNSRVYKHNKMTGWTSENQLAFLLQRMDSVFACKSLDDVLSRVGALLDMGFKECKIAFHENEHTNTSFLPKQNHYFAYTDESVLGIGRQLAFLLARMKRRHVIQLGCGAIDLSDNGAFQVFVITGKNDTVEYNIKSTAIGGLVLARDKKSADIAWHHREDAGESLLTNEGVVLLCGASIEEWKKLATNRINDAYVYIIPADSGGGLCLKPEECCYSIFTSQQKLSYLDIQVLKTLVSRVFARLHDIVYKRRIDEASVMSAIGSIMSRNGSHNIGSHVLAALSHNVGTMPDDRVLYQYIQHRMDYIATATTERPLWRQPTMFVSCMMKEFLKQTHLLEYISGSEGLHAYKFQGQAVGKQSRTIRIHVRKIYGDGMSGWWKDGRLGSNHKDVAEFIRYGQEPLDFAKDVAVAIPGGIVGQHAFFTIIENVLRNAAKHEWSEAMRVWKIALAELEGAECEKLQDKCEPQNLDLYIDFHDNAASGKIECCVWNNRVVSVLNTALLWSHIIVKWFGGARTEELGKRLDVMSNLLLPLYKVLKKHAIGMQKNIVFKLIDSMMTSQGDADLLDPRLEGELCAKLEEYASTARYAEVEACRQTFQDFLQNAMNLEGKDLTAKLREKIEASFIDSTGLLRKENWGIAEMRISAGFLRSSDIAQIGGLPGAKSALALIAPVLVKNKDGDECIGYRFDLEKPKELLVVLDSRTRELDDRKIEEINNGSRRYGISFIASDRIRKDKAYPYSYVLFEFLDKVLMKALICKEMAFPFRMLAKRVEAKGEELSRCRKFVAKYGGKFFDNALSVIKTSVYSESTLRDLQEDVYADWLRHARYRHCEKSGRVKSDGAPKLILDIDGDGQGGEQTLISSAVLLNFVYHNTFNAAVRSFLKANGPDACTGVITKSSGNDKRQVVVSLSEPVAAVLYSLTIMPERDVYDIEEMAKETHRNLSYFDGNESEAVKLQLEKWIDKLLNGEYVDVDSKEINRDKSEIGDSWANRLRVGDQISKRVHTGTIDDFYADEENLYWLRRFCKYIATDIFRQADSFLRKYEERFSTLPINFTGSSGVGEVKNEWIWTLHDSEIRPHNIIQEVYIERSESRRAAAEKNEDICYLRHGKKELPNIGKQYYEPLSGAQGMLNSFMAFRDDLELMRNGNRGESAHAYTEARLRAMRFVTGLVENAMMRVLIIDERVARFMREHSEVRKIIGGLGIAVADDKEPQVLQLFAAELSTFSPFFSELKLTEFEIVIIHQGVIDKLLPGHEDKAVVEKWLNRLIEKLRYVVITTGRGSPANIPNTARVLPYSIIENSILQRYPEKMILVDAVMNMLPMKTEVVYDNCNIHS